MRGRKAQHTQSPAQHSTQTAQYLPARVIELRGVDTALGVQRPCECEKKEGERRRERCVLVLGEKCRRRKEGAA
jgi:hypothetical protein